MMMVVMLEVVKMQCRPTQSEGPMQPTLLHVQSDEIVMGFSKLAAAGRQATLRETRSRSLPITGSFA